LGLATSLAITTAAQAGVIRGQVRSTDSSVRRATITAAAVDLGQCVVWVDSLPQGVSRRYSGRYRDAVITQRGRQFSPRVTVVIAGTTIRFANRDEVYHNVFSPSPAKTFDLGKSRPRGVHRVRFDHPGLVNLFCAIHPDMAAYVMVLPHRLFARPNRAGRFAMPPVPPGRYTLRVWHPLLGETTRPVDVPRYGDVQVTIGL
jgi:plastocyanin